MRSSASEDWPPYRDEAKCGEAFDTFDTYEWVSIASNGGWAWDK